MCLMGATFEALLNWSGGSNHGNGTAAQLTSSKKTPSPPSLTVVLVLSGKFSP